MKSSASICWENLIKTKLLKKDFQVVRCLGWLVSLQYITFPTANDNVENNTHLIDIILSTANDNVENNTYLIPLWLELGTLRVLGARDNHYKTESL